MTYQDYKTLMERYNQLAAVSADAGETEESLIKKLMDNSYAKKQILTETNAIIKEYIAKYESDATQLDEEAAAMLRDFLNQLMPVNGNGDYVDPCISLRICRLLLSYYQSMQDLEQIVPMLYWCAMFDFMLKGHQDDAGSSPYTLMAEQYLDGLEKLSDQGKLMLIHCWMLCVYNRKDLDFGLRKYRSIQKTFQEIRQKMGEDFCRKQFIQCQTYVLCYAMHGWHRAEYTSLESPALSWTVDDLRKESALIEELASELKKVLDSDSARDMLADRGLMRYYLNQVEYYMGRIDMAELLRRIEALTHPREDYTIIERCSALFTLNVFYLEYLCKSELFDRRTMQTKALQIIDHVRRNMDEAFAGLSEMNRYVSRYQCNLYLLELISAASNIVEFDFFKGIVLDATIYANKELYVHTMMVKEICLVLLDYVLNHNPQYLNGVAGQSWEYWCDHKSEALALMENSALLHDIGKYYCLDYVTNSSRNLTDDEFEIIKYHPTNFSTIYQCSTNALTGCIRDCAHLHHLWYNEKGGYPREKHTANRPFVNILTIADCIDAATDNIGRPYGMEKTLEQLTVEFDSAKGSRYCEQISDLLHVEEIQKKINYIINERRKEIYCDIYLREQEIK